MTIDQFRERMATGEPVYHYLHSIARNDAETAAQVYSEWISRSEQIDVSLHAPRT